MLAAARHARIRREVVSRVSEVSDRPPQSRKPVRPWSESRQTPRSPIAPGIPEFPIAIRGLAWLLDLQGLQYCGHLKSAPGRMIPQSYASTTACTRSRRPSFARMRVMWVLTVASPM